MLVRPVLAFCLLVLPCACSRAPDEPPPEVPTARPTNSVPAPVRVTDIGLMDRARDEAQRTLPDFLQVLQKPRPTQRGFSIKKGYPIPGGEFEHMWLTPVRWDGTQFQGIINNEPQLTAAVDVGDQVVVLPEELSDWMYFDEGEIVGAYTLRVDYWQATPEEQAVLREQLGFEVPPIDF